jgi:hypothetical protein
METRSVTMAGLAGAAELGAVADIPRADSRISANPSQMNRPVI